MEDYRHGFDRIVCITLEGRDDRRKAAEETFASIGILSIVRFFVARPHPEGGRAGCFDSHVRVLSACLDDPECQTALVFEDDVAPTPGYSLQGVKRAAEFVRSTPPSDWDVLMLGYMPLDVLRMFETPAARVPGVLANNLLPFVGTTEHQEGVVRYNNAILAHANVYNRTSMHRIVREGTVELARKSEVRHYDQFVSDTSTNIFCLTPMLFDQRLCYASDNKVLNSSETAMRRWMCVAENTNFLYWLSETRRHVPAMCVALIVAYVAMALLILCASRRRGRGK
jgi:hypothetical protein